MILRPPLATTHGSPISDFKVSPGRVFPAIELVDLYPLFTHLLDVQPQPNNGTWGRVSSMLVSAAPCPAPRHAPLLLILLLLPALS